MPADPYRYFRVEARELLERLGQGILELEKGAAPELVAQLLRLSHTLKGAARVVKQRKIADRAHAIEDLLTPARDSPTTIPKEAIDAVLRHLDDIAAKVTALAPPADLEGVPRPRGAGGEAFDTVRAEIADMDELLAGLAEAHTQLGSLRRELHATERARHLIAFLHDHLTSPRSLAVAKAGNGATSGKVGAVVEELKMHFGSLERGLGATVEQIDRELRQVRQAAERLRLVSAGALFTLLERAVRDVAKTLGKRVAFEGHGGNVRLDAHVLGTIQGALLQLVSNAVVHGIETGAQRQAAGKPLEGRVVLEVTRRGRRVVFTCRDDGGGVDLEAVRRVAQQRGLAPGEAQRLGVDEILRLVLEGGVSTSGAVTEVAGRGIGLDVVREAVERLGGEVIVRSESGRGTRIDLVVPLSLASLEGLLVEAAGLSVVIPLDAVRGTVSLAANQVTRSPRGDSVSYQGKVIPLLSLGRVFRGSTSRPRNDASASVVILQAESGMAAIAVEGLHGIANVVLRPLPPLTPAAPLIAGASLDEEGNPRLVLDAEALVTEAQNATAAEAAPEVRRPPVLVIDDSLTTRMLEQSILESAGYEVDVATSGEEAIEKARRKRYALFLVDIEMPGLDGFGFIERTRADPVLRDIPSILVTSRASPEDRRRGEEVGARAYIVKSEFEQAELLGRLQELMG